MLSKQASVMAAITCALILNACSGSDGNSDGNTSTSPVTVAGTVVAHDGVSPVTGAVVTGFYRDGGMQRTDWNPAPLPATRTVTTADGTFSLTFRPGDEDRPVGVQVTFPLPQATQATGEATSFQVRSSVDLGTTANLVTLPGTLKPCQGDAQICGVPMLPDLTPILGADNMAPVARDLLLEQQAQLGEADQGIFPIETWFVTEEDGRRLLRFASLTANVGPGPLEIVADEPTSETGDSTVSTRQRIWTDTWTYHDRQAGEFIFHQGHDHTHFDAFERYRLLTLDGRVVAESAKVSFCLRDSIRVLDTAEPNAGLFTDIRSCGTTQQAINSGFGDHYDQFLPDQWIDITGVPAGDYEVEITVDPLGQIIEVDETNNRGTFAVTID